MAEQKRAKNYQEVQAMKNLSESAIKINQLLDQIEQLEHELCRCKETINALREINDNQWGIIQDMRKERKNQRA